VRKRAAGSGTEGVGLDEAYEAGDWSNTEEFGNLMWDQAEEARSIATAAMMNRQYGNHEFLR